MEPMFSTSRFERECTMKRCLVCQCCFESEKWDCPQCGCRPMSRNGVLCFIEDPPLAGNGFKPEYFAKLATFEEGNFWFRARNRLIQWALANYFPNAESFFEVGCGTGFVLSGVSETSPRMRLAGSEIFDDGLVFARARLPGVDLYQMDARHIPFEREFDVIGAFDVLEHVVEDDVVLRQMFMATRPGGGLLVTVPQHRFLWSASDEHAMHQRRYSRTELRSKVEQAGFDIERITSFISLLLPVMIYSRMKRNSSRDFQLWREFEISRPLNAVLANILAVERALVERGVSFPAGGSLLLIAKRPPTGQ
jgi:SAM-dependent methyltransferase